MIGDSVLTMKSLIKSINALLDQAEPGRKG